MKKIAFYTLLIIFKLTFNVESSPWEWKTFTSKLQVREICGGETLLWCGTEGGLLALYPDEKRFKSWTNTEGVAYNNITAIACDENEQIWIGMSNGLIQRFDPATSNWLLIDDFQNHQIKCFALTGDTLFVGLDIGISIYLISRQEVKETYRHLGLEFQIEIPVNDILIMGKEIWVATDEGIAHSRLDFPNLLDPESWTNVISEDGLPISEVRSLTVLDDKIYAGTSEGIAEWNGNYWTAVNGTATQDLIIHENKLYQASTDGIFYMEDNNWHKLGSSLSSIENMASAFSTIWVGTSNGIYFYSTEEKTWEHCVPNCPGSNLISDFSIDLDGNLWCCSRDNGFFQYDGQIWTTYNQKTLHGLRSRDFVSVTVDTRNNKWFGSWGGGAVFMKYDSTFQFFHAENDYLAGISANHKYSVVNDILVDSSGTIWLLNRESVKNLPLIAINQELDWTYYGTNEGISTIYLSAISVDLDGRKWIGSNTPGQNGIFVLDDNGTPSDPSDDPPIGRLTTNYGLESDNISALAVDKFGGVWIGTPVGLHYYFAGAVERRYGLPVDNVTALTVDGVNNLWVGTTAGVSLFSYETYTWTYFSEDNSDLVSNNVNSLFMDNSTGNLYIGTSSGFSRLETPFAEPVPHLSELKIYPNPFIPYEHSYLNIDNLTFNVTVKILTASGYLIRRFDRSEINGKRILWDGTNESNEPVAGGIYLIVVQSEEGENAAGKVALVR